MKIPTKEINSIVSDFLRQNEDELGNVELNEKNITIFLSSLSSLVREYLDLQYLNEFEKDILNNFLFNEYKINKRKKELLFDLD